MPRCENELCGKTGLTKDDIELDGVDQKILCRECYNTAHHAEVLPPKRELNLEFHVTLQDGLTAEASYGGYSLSLKASPAELRKLTGIR